MKKFGMIVLGLCFFFLIVPAANAQTTFQREQVEDGKIKLMISTNDTGYVTALQVTIKVNGGVTPIALRWDESIKASYSRKVLWNKDNNTLKVIIATGNEDNLLNASGTISLGVLDFSKNTTSNDLFYDVILDTDSTVETMNLLYEKTVLNNIVIPEQAVFVLKAAPTQNEDPNNNNGQIDTDAPSNNGPVKGDSEDNENVEDLTKDENQEQKNDSKTDTKAVKEQSIDVKVTIGLITLIVVLGGVVLVLKKKKQI